MKERLKLTIDGEDYVALSRDAYDRLIEAAEDAADSAAIARFEQRLAAGEEEFVPSAIVDRILAGENLVRVWREHRGLTVSALAEMAGIAQPYLSQIETGKREGTLQTMKKIAGALRVKLDDLV
ncbi:helix-turn-helix domain-containing protein [Tabrizicola sp.]|uniref:helix-turn-helix domain-containing protein n=1 Tax=Tabrizicola sp. TaxID=2005166 RepID=UPI0027348A62|nr:helix-turn-helix transcriptional regulator [Tabrizicola sp.]MDP3197256.1 helix-turn-helix transcriptional regulator [Tabrizicola sp.]MDP3320518.1 helix-turn-helix transcriptional regulator [Bosea sp. (in: a-proteobacteria)]